MGFKGYRVGEDSPQYDTYVVAREVDFKTIDSFGHAKSQGIRCWRLQSSVNLLSQVSPHNSCLPSPQKHYSLSRTYICEKALCLSGEIMTCVPFSAYYLQQ